MINCMSRATNTPLTPRHLEILEWCYNYYCENKVGPLYYTIKKGLGADKTEIGTLFPYGLNSVYTWIGIPIQSINNTCKPPADIHAPDYREIYFDHNATTPLRKEVTNLLLDYFNGKFGFGNPSSSTTVGRKAFEQVYNARTTIADLLSVMPENVYFTGSGSESNNLAVKGIVLKQQNSKGHIVSSVTEHPSIINTINYLCSIGFTATFVEVNSQGIVEPESVLKAIREDTILVTIMAVNNEIGTINPIAEIGKICKDKGIVFAVDAIQGFGKIPIDIDKMNIDILTFSGHKIYAPKGIGGIYINPKLNITPIIHGGGQESGLRSGTENVAYISAFAKASELAFGEMENERFRLTKLRQYILERIKKIEPGIIVNGSIDKRTANNLNIGFPWVDSGALLLSLDKIGISASVGSACSSGKYETSPVIKALGVDASKYGVLRISLGLYSTREDADYFLKYLPKILKKIKDPL